jgi:hypothetical protein
MGEVIHGDYTRWANNDTLHAVTNYTLHKALYSGHNDHNYFEIAHTVKRLYDMAGGNPLGLRLYNFVDNHDVARIYSKLSNKAHMIPVHILLYTLPGIPSIYYGSEFGIEGNKENGSDASLRPQLNLKDLENAKNENPLTKVIAALGEIRAKSFALSYGDYTQLQLTNRQYAFSRNVNGENVIVVVNNDDSDCMMTLPANSVDEYVGALSGERIRAEGGNINVNVKACGGDIFLPLNDVTGEYKPVDYSKVLKDVEKQTKSKENQEKKLSKSLPENVRDVSYEEMTVEELQACIIGKMRNNGEVTEEMRRTVMENVYHDSLVNWARSF